MLLGSASGSVHGDSLLELDELLELGELPLDRLLVLDRLLALDRLLVLDRLELDALLRPLLELGSDDPEALLRDELLDGCDDVLLSELPLPSELAEDKELPDVSDDELLPGGRYRLLELMPGRYELDELLLPRGGGGTTGGLGAHGGAQQLGGYGGYGG
jgi:hypothetical protein